MRDFLKNKFYEISLLSAIPVLMINRAIDRCDVEHFGLLIKRFEKILSRQSLATNSILFNIYTKIHPREGVVSSSKSEYCRMAESAHHQGLHFSPSNVVSNMMVLISHQEWGLLKTMLDTMPQKSLFRDDAHILAIYTSSMLSHFGNRIPPPDHLIIKMIEKFDLDPLRSVGQLKFDFFERHLFPASSNFIHDNHNLWNISLQNVLSSSVLHVLFDRLPHSDQPGSASRDVILNETAALFQRSASIDPALLLKMDDAQMGVKHVLAYVLNTRHDGDVTEEDISSEVIDRCLSSNPTLLSDLHKAAQLRQSQEDHSALSQELSEFVVTPPHPAKRMKM